MISMERSTLIAIRRALIVVLRMIEDSLGLPGEQRVTKAVQQNDT
jgi:hypothetical protein